jgi:hypothetical protein
MITCSSWYFSGSACGSPLALMVSRFSVVCRRTAMSGSGKFVPADGRLQLIPAFTGAASHETVTFPGVRGSPAIHDPAAPPC